jgi:putative transposase
VAVQGKCRSFRANPRFLIHPEGQFPAKSDPYGRRFAVRKSFSVEQIVAVVKHAETGVPVMEVCRRVGIPEQAFYRWKKKFVYSEIDQVRQLKQLQDEKTVLKELVA